MAQQGGKGGGARKYGRNKRYPGKMGYTQETRLKGRKVARAIRAGIHQPGWQLTEAGKPFKVK